MWHHLAGVKGLLAVYDLSQDSRLLDKAKELADRLMPDFDLAATGVFCFHSDSPSLSSCSLQFWGACWRRTS